MSISFSSIMNNQNDDAYIDDDLLFLDDQEYLTILDDISHKQSIIDDGYFLLDYFETHQLDSLSLSIAGKHQSVIHELNVQLPAIESLNTNLYATDQFKASLSDKLDIALEGIVELWDKFWNWCKKLYQKFMDKFNYYNDACAAIAEQFTEFDTNFNQDKLDTSKVKDKKVDTYTPDFVKTVIKDARGILSNTGKSIQIDWTKDLFNNPVKKVLKDENKYSSVKDENVINERTGIGFNKLGLRYKKLSTTLQRFREKNKGLESKDLIDAYVSYYKGGKSSSIYKGIALIPGIVTSIKNNQNKIESAIKNAKNLDRHNKKSGTEAKDKMFKGKSTKSDLQQRGMNKVISMYKNIYEDIFFVEKCLLMLMQNYLSVSKKILATPKAKQNNP